MSVYRDSGNGSVSFQHPIGTPLTATIKDANGAVLFTSDPISSFPDFTTGGSTYNLVVPWQATQYDGKRTVVWEDGNGFSRTQTFEVVTPIVDFSRLAALWTDQFAPYGDMVTLEGTVRTIIESYTGQSFGLGQSADTYVGNGTGKLILKKRLLQVNGVLGGYGMYESNWVAPGGETNEIGQLNLDKLGTIQDGWAVLFNWPEFLDVRQAPPMELIQFAPAQDGTIRVPRRVMRERDKGAHYLINAQWGYDAVPEDVQQAALLLAGDYLAGDSEYRDRYLEILKIQQDSFTYHPGAFRGTGNARADLLLGPYRRQNGMVIL